MRIDVRAVDGSVATRAETRAPLQKLCRGESRMRHLANENCAVTAGCGYLSMAFQAQVVVPFGQHLRVDRAVDVVTAGATFTQGLVLEHVRPGLLAMAAGADIIDPRQPQSFWLVDVFAVRIVAVGATHSAFVDRMVILQAKLRLLVEMTLETGFRIFRRIDDELALPAAGIHMQTACAVTGFAPLPFHTRAFALNP